MPQIKLTPDDLDTIKRGYLMRLSATDTAQVLNLTRNPEERITPSAVSYQYSKLQSQGLRRCTPEEVTQYHARALQSTPWIKAEDFK